MRPGPVSGGNDHEQGEPALISGRDADYHRKWMVTPAAGASSSSCTPG
jgi:hypothetical protein